MKKPKQNAPAQVPPAGLNDAVVNQFFAEYVDSARQRLKKARHHNERWSVLRAVCRDLAEFRQAGHQMQRIEIWKKKLSLEVRSKIKNREEELIQYVAKHPEIKDKLFPPENVLTQEEKEERIREILGLEPVDPKNEIVKLRAYIRGYAKQLRAQGKPVPPPYPDDEPETFLDEKAKNSENATPPPGKEGQ